MSEVRKTKFVDGDFVIFNGKRRKIYSVAFYGHRECDSYFKPGVGIVLKKGATEVQHYVLCRPNSNCGYFGKYVSEDRLKPADAE